MRKGRTTMAAVRAWAEISLGSFIRQTLPRRQAWAQLLVIRILQRQLRPCHGSSSTQPWPSCRALLFHSQMLEQGTKARVTSW